MSTKFIFDLDGTLTKHETLPIISSHFNIENEIDTLTKDTIQGNVPFIESFIKRVMILGTLPIDEIQDLLNNVALHEKLLQFIQENKENCIIATGNLECWIKKLIEKINCKTYCSTCITKDNHVQKLITILRKENIVKELKNNGDRVVFIGDGNNDMEAMRIADVSIASGLIHMPAKSVLSISNYAVFNEESLCRLLNQLL